MAPPEATRTFLFTDVEGSTRLWEQHPREMKAALERHEVLLRDAITGADGEVVKTTGDGLMAAFAAPLPAVSAAIVAQRTLIAEPWPATCPIRVRIGVHTGEAEARGGDYFGPAVNRAARIMSAGHGGQILLSGATAALVEGGLPAAISLRDLGEHRLKDLGRPERLVQIAARDLPSEFPPLATLDRRPNNLPTQASAFVGRDDVLHDLRGRLDDSTVRLVTLTGPGGTGKTRLALRAAADQIDRFPDGVFFVDLVSATNAEGVLALVAGAVGLADVTERSPLNELRRHLRTQQVLLVLDNFEQVTVAAPVLLELLADCPALKLLVTSRQALRVRGENVVSVPPLSLPAARHAATADELSQFEAIQLFVERARAVRSDFRLTDDNASAVAEICRRLDGLPLAIELATARMNLFSPEALRDRLGSRLKLLGGGARDLPARQQTLRATIEWSYQLLDAGEQRLLELLSVFAGCSVEAVEAVAAGVSPAAEVELDPIDGLGSLLDKSLIRQAEATDSGEAPRIVMLETIREYAAEQLEARPELGLAARTHHARYFADFAAEAARGGDEEAAAGSDEVAIESDNLRMAWGHWVAQGDLERLRQLKGALWPLYDRRGWYHATVEVVRDMLGVVTALPDRAARWQEELTLRTSLARALTLHRGYTGEAEDAYAEALALLREHPDVPLLFPVLRNLASFYGFRGEMPKSIEAAHQILGLADADDSPMIRVDGKAILGANTGFGGQLETGLGHLDDAIRIFESPGYRPRGFRLGVDVRVSCLTTSGFFLWLLGRPDQAVARADRAVALAAELDHPYSLAYAQFHNGFLHLWRREPELVAMRATAAIRVAEASDLLIWRALGTTLLGAATSGLGSPAEGLRQIADGLDQYRDLRTPPVFWPFIRFLQAGAHVEAGRAEAGLELIDEALALGGGSPIAPLFHVVRGDLLLAGPDPDDQAASRAYRQAYDLAEELEVRSAQLRAAVRLCRIARPEGRPAAIAALRTVHARFSEGLATPDLRDAASLLASGPD